MIKLKLLFLNNPKGFYHGGEKVEGAVQVELSSETKLTHLNVTYHGFARVEFIKGFKSYTSKEEYFKTNETIWQSGNKHESIAKGIHLFDFEFLLPENLPSSLKSKFADIKYVVKARLARPWRIDSTVEETFPVQSDTSEIQRQMVWSVPPRNEVTTNYTRICCHSAGRFAVSLRLEKNCFAPGETVQAWACIQNESSRYVRYTEAMLVKTISLKAMGQEEMLNQILACKMRGKIKPGESVWDMNYALQIPTGEFSVFDQHCRIISVTYAVKLIVHFSGVAKIVKVPVKMLVCSTPAADVQTVDVRFPGPTNFDAFTTTEGYIHIPDTSKAWHSTLDGIHNTSFGVQ